MNTELANDSVRERYNVEIDGIAMAQLGLADSSS